MATIKTQTVSGQLFVVTKTTDGQKRVSCSCCDDAGGECCMYPAAAFANGDFSEDDLPDEIFLLPFDLSAIDTDYEGQVVQRNGTIYGPADFEGFTQQVTYREDFEGLGPQWTADTDSTAIETQPCLSENIDVNRYWRDNFEDAYEINVLQKNATVNRVETCVWIGEDSDGCEIILRYEDRVAPPREGSRYKWTVNYAEGGLEPCAERAIAIKNENQNTPVGSYENGVEVS